MRNAVHTRSSNAKKGLVLLSAAVGTALLVVAGALSVGTVTADVDARYRVETAPIDVSLCQQGLVLMIR